MQSTLNFSCVFFFCCFFFYGKQQKQRCIPQSKNFSQLALNLAISLVLEIHMIAVIPAITERVVQQSYQSCGNHSTVIVAFTALRQPIIILCYPVDSAILLSNNWGQFYFYAIWKPLSGSTMIIVSVIIWKTVFRDKTSYIFEHINCFIKLNHGSLLFAIIV